MRRVRVLAAGLAALLAAAAPAAAYTPAPPLGSIDDLLTSLMPAGDRVSGPMIDAMRSLVESLVAAERPTDTDRAILSFYRSRDFEPFWIANGRLTPISQGIIHRLARADYDGLDPGSYATPPRQLGRSGADFAAFANAELELTRAVLAYAHDAAVGRLDPRSISPSFGYRPVAPDPRDVLATVTSARLPVEALVSYGPQNRAFVELRQRLAFERNAPAPEPFLRVPDGILLRPGVTNERVAILRERLELPSSDAPDVFDDDVEAAVVAFQTENGLRADGVVGPNTYAKLNGDEPVDRVAEIIANMEMLRWMPQDLGRYYVHVNIPNFALEIRRDGEAFYTTRVVVGTRDNQTPIFGDEIEHIVVNPYWNVPVSIAANELLPAFRRDPGYILRNNYEVRTDAGVVDPWATNWSAVGPNQVRIRQRPGGGNALGNIKFLFPNQYDVYLHDTPSKGLFQNEVRAYSHGCIRVMNPMEFADALLSEDPNLGAAELRALFGPSERWVNLDTHIPVFITYSTAWVDDAGELQFAADLYGHSAKIQEALGLEPEA